MSPPLQTQACRASITSVRDLTLKHGATHSPGRAVPSDVARRRARRRRGVRLDRPNVARRLRVRQHLRSALCRARVLLRRRGGDGRRHGTGRRAALLLCERRRGGRWDPQGVGWTASTSTLAGTGFGVCRGDHTSSLRIDHLSVAVVILRALESLISEACAIVAAALVVLVRRFARRRLLVLRLARCCPACLSVRASLVDCVSSSSVPRPAAHKQRNTTQHSTTRRTTTQHNTTQTHRNTTQHSTTQRNTTQRNVTQRNATQQQHNTTRKQTKETHDSKTVVLVASRSSST